MKCFLKAKTLSNVFVVTIVTKLLKVVFLFSRKNSSSLAIEDGGGGVRSAFHFIRKFQNYICFIDEQLS